jgi:hypothetical protein
MKIIYAIMVYCNRCFSDEKYLDKTFIDYTTAEEYAEKTLSFVRI